MWLINSKKIELLILVRQDFELCRRKPQIKYQKATIDCEIELCILFQIIQIQKNIYRILRKINTLYTQSRLWCEWIHKLLEFLTSNLNTAGAIVFKFHIKRLWKTAYSLLRMKFDDSVSGLLTFYYFVYYLHFKNT